MGRTYKYKTIEALLKANIDYLEWGIDLESLTYGRIYSDKKRDWINFELPKEECERLAKMIVECLNFRKGTNKERILERIAYCIMVHKEITVTSRLHIGLYGGKVNCNYCTGQDYIHETRAIRKELAKF